MKSLAAVFLALLGFHGAHAQSGPCTNQGVTGSAEFLVAGFVSPFEQEPNSSERPPIDVGTGSEELGGNLNGKLSLSTKQAGPGKALLVLSSTIDDVVGFVVVAPERGDILLRVYSDLMKDVVVAAAPDSTPLADVSIMDDHLTLEELKSGIPYDLSTVAHLEVRVVKADSTVHPVGFRGKFADTTVTIVAESNHNCHDVWLSYGSQQNCAHERCCGLMAPCTYCGPNGECQITCPPCSPF